MVEPQIDSDPTMVNLTAETQEQTDKRMAMELFPDIPKRTAHDMFGHLIGLRLAITEVLDELTVDGIQGHPRTVLMALRGLESQAKELVAIAKGEIEAAK